MKAGLPALLDVLACRPQLVGERLEYFVICLTCHKELGHNDVVCFTYAELFFRLLDNRGFSILGTSEDSSQTLC